MNTIKFFEKLANTAHHHLEYENLFLQLDKIIQNDLLTSDSVPYHADTCMVISS